MVLILVVMEDALALFDKEFVSNLFGGLNPCCNGRCTRTLLIFLIKRTGESLNPCCNGRCTRTSRPLGGMAVVTAS